MQVMKSSDPHRARTDGKDCHLGLGNDSAGEPRGCTGDGVTAVHIPGHGRFILCPGHVAEARSW